MRRKERIDCQIKWVDLFYVFNRKWKLKERKQDHKYIKTNQSTKLTIEQNFMKNMKYFYGFFIKKNCF